MIKSTLQPGVFVFPFQFHLDHNLPGSCSVAFGRQRDRSVIVYLHKQSSPGSSNPTWSTLKSCEWSSPKGKWPWRRKRTRRRMSRSCVASPKGRVSLSANLVKNMYYPNETVEVKLQINNSESKVNLKACSLELVRERGAVCQGGGRRATATKVAKASSPNIAEGEYATGPFKCSSHPLIEPSTHARIMSCTYELVVRLSVPWSPDVVLAQPVQILNAPLTLILLPSHTSPIRS